MHSYSIKKCSDCGKGILHKVYPSGLCEGCYNYYRKGGTVNPIPDLGVIAYDERGYVVCHICGKAYKRLGSHVKETHNMRMSLYKEKYGICNSAKTTEERYSQAMRDYAYKNGMPERLIELGVNTRVKKGETKLRGGKKSRLQECLERSNRYTKNRPKK